MKKVSSTPNMSGGILGSSPRPSMHLKRPSSISSISSMTTSDTIESVFDAVVHETQLESVMHVPINNLLPCIEQYGFPSEVINSANEEQKKNLVACLSPLEEQTTESLRLLENIKKFESEIIINERYIKILQLVRRQRRLSTI